VKGYGYAVLVFADYVDESDRPACKSTGEGLLSIEQYFDSAFNVRFWIVVNNQLGTYRRTVQPAWPKLMTRSLEMAIRASTLASLKSIELAARLMNLQGRVKVELRFIAIPDDWRPPVEGSFQKETMESLAELGFELGSDPSTWRTKVPNPESPTPGNGR